MPYQFNALITRYRSALLQLQTTLASMQVHPSQVDDLVNLQAAVQQRLTNLANFVRAHFAQQLMLPCTS